MQEPDDKTNTQAALLSQFVKLMKQGFPQQGMAEYDAKVAALPEESRKELGELTQLSEALRSAFTRENISRPR